jgi:hypothetical protein
MKQRNYDWTYDQTGSLILRYATIMYSATLILLRLYDEFLENFALKD